MLKQIKTKIQEYKNGKELEKQSCTPLQFVSKVIIPIIQQTELPTIQVNQDDFRRQKDQKLAIKDIDLAIKSAYVNKQCCFKNYLLETPYNKMLLWGIMFESLYEVLIGETLKQYPRTIKTINTQQYIKLPKRYRGIFKKDGKHPNLYSTVLKSGKEKFAIYHNFKIDENFEVFTKRIRDLISLLYKETVIDYWEEITDETYLGIGKVHDIYGQKTNEDFTKSKFVSDKQMDAIIELQKIFTKIASEVYVTKIKHGNTEIWNEMQDEQSRNHIFWRAQKLTRTANQLVVSTRKATEFCSERQIRQATVHFNHVKNNVMSELRKKTNIRIK